MTEPRRAPLATGEQRDLEQLALRIRGASVVQEAAAALRAEYRASPVGRTASGAATLDAAVDAVVMAAISEAVVLDPGRPRAMWNSCAAHTWFGHTFPNSGYGIENPDNVYRHIGIDDAGQFVLEGRYDAAAGRPMDFSLVVYGEVPGTGAITREGAPILGLFSAADLHVRDDGSFTISLGPDAPDGRGDHLQLAPGSILLIVRESLSDWADEMPAAVTVTRTDPAPGPPPTEERLAARAARFVDALGRYWGIDYNRAAIYSRMVNEVTDVARRGIGMATAGHFDLPDGHALVVTVEPKRARYLGFQLADPWGVAREYVERTGSLNDAQATPNADGSFTFVISATDPGVWNWLDTGGISAGLFAIRWQPVPADEAPDGAVRTAQVVPLDELPAALPPGAVTIDAAARHTQLAERRAAYERRYRGG